MPCEPILFPFVSSILSGAWLVSVGPYSYRLAAQECSLPQRVFTPPKQFDWRDYFLGLLHPCCFHYSAAVPRSGHRKNPHLFDHGRGTAVLSCTWTPRIFHYCGRDIRWPTVCHWLKAQRRRRTFFSPCKNRACSVGGYGRSAEFSPLVSVRIYLRPLVRSFGYKHRDLCSLCEMATPKFPFLCQHPTSQMCFHGGRHFFVGGLWTICSWLVK
ncbi:uncharacterized protein CIMG_10600 [Coccidioides immitis RS]|uniref:Uncharacterized protein n=3 Tax=Coccidioides immitis TaxID=5501 RepID=A0A0D8JVH6_COCIM|nr:uncharacterized protein CIMG_10600 [Coccidioides immitis RS]KJF60283.1 hypothetical protein CIMG_10600 [Coccidioides immitis RS]KMP00534.1 hypothetical protein CIRG_00676 [Coccidioides immitis RMSCC 2394]KMU89539.1 hypothetical protein CIHG_07346 [Coccidioides immitis H538.4]